MRRFLVLSALFLAFGTSALLAIPALAGGEPDGFNESTIAENLRVPTAFTFLPAGEVLILERDGRLLIADPSGSPSVPAEALQVPNVDLIGERGATAVTVDPDFASNGHIYIWYAALGTDTMRLSRFTMIGNTSDPASEFIVWESPDTHESSEFHYGGGIEFGPNGKIWFSVGDRSIPESAQDVTSSSGKIHRVNPDGSVPTDNPFYDGLGPNIDSIFTYGLRNPFRIRWGGDKLYVAEVGQDANEDLNIVSLDQPGQNFGWPLCEGECQDPAYTDPAWTYQHGQDTYSQFPDSEIPNTRFGASITGGDVYDAAVFPAEYHGAYFFGDYANRWVSYLTFAPDGSATYHPFVRDIGPVVDVRVGPGGAVYYLSLLTDNSNDFGSSGYLRRIAYSLGNQPPVIATASATPESGPEPLVVTFSAAATDPEGSALTYTWITGDGAELNGVEVSHVYNTAGPYFARVEVSDGERVAVSPSILIQVGTLPVVTIESPIDLDTFRAGDVITLAGGSDDAADQLVWEVVLGHDTHQHPRLVASGPMASYTVPSTDHSFSDSTWFDVTLTATDAAGLSSSSSVRLEPEKVDISFVTSPAGLNLLLDGVQFTTPRTVDTLIGFEHAVEAPASQISAGRVFEFDSWASGNSRIFAYVVPDQNSSLVATYVDVGPAPIQFQYLSDLPFVSSENAKGPIERDMSNGQDLGRDGMPISIAGQPYLKGLGMQADANAVVAVPASCTSFEAVVGIDDSVGSAGSVAFAVEVDGAVAFTSGVLTGADAGQQISIDVEGASIVALKVTTTADGADADHADWADARFACSDPGPGPDTQAPSFPVQTMQSSSVTATSADLAWAPAMDNVEVLGYNVYANGELVATTYEPVANVAGLQPSTTIDFSAQAFDGAGNETLFGPRLDVRTADLDTPGPQPPTANDDAATVIQGGSVTIDVTGNDVDPDGDDLVGVTLVNGPSSGVAIVVDDRIIYTHDGSTSTVDDVRYVVGDGTFVSGVATVTIAVLKPTEALSVQLGMADPATGLWTLMGVEPFYYGAPGDAPISGDWDCDGIDTVGMYRSSNGLVYLRNSNTTGVAEREFLLGLEGDIPMSGDFNGDGCDTISIYRPAEGRIYVANELGDAGGVIVADYSFFFGIPGDRPFTGDFTGDGRTGVGLYRPTSGLVYFTNEPVDGVAPTDAEFYFGDPGDRFVAGDWNGNGIETAGIFRPTDGVFYLRFSNTQGTADLTTAFGHSTWIPVAGVFG